mgnify:CR=1 FL=1
MIGYLTWFLVVTSSFTTMAHSVCPSEHTSVATMVLNYTQASLPNCESVGSQLDPPWHRPATRFDPMTLNACYQDISSPSMHQLPTPSSCSHSKMLAESAGSLSPPLTIKWDRWRYKRKKRKKKPKSQNWTDRDEHHSGAEHCCQFPPESRNICNKSRGGHGYNKNVQVTKTMRKLVQSCGTSDSHFCYVVTVRFFSYFSLTLSCGSLEKTATLRPSQLFFSSRALLPRCCLYNLQVHYNSSQFSIALTLFPLRSPPSWLRILILLGLVPTMGGLEK